MQRNRRFSTALAVVVLVTLGIGATGVRPGGAVVCADLIPSDDEYTTNFGQTLRVNEPGLLANDSGSTPLVETSWGVPISNPDPSDDFSLWGNAEIRYGNPNGALNHRGGFTYTPDPDPNYPFSGIDQFDDWMIDACGNEDRATAYITVLPTVVDSSYTTAVNTPLAVDTAGGFLANDLGIDPASMFYDLTSLQGGNVDDSGASDGSFVYTPPAGFVGADSFRIPGQRHQRRQHVRRHGEHPGRRSDRAHNHQRDGGQSPSDGDVQRRRPERLAHHVVHRDRVTGRTDHDRFRVAPRRERVDQRHDVPVHRPQVGGRRTGRRVGPVERRRPRRRSRAVRHDERADERRPTLDERDRVVARH